MKPQPEPELALSHYYVTQRRAKCEGGYCATLRACKKRRWGMYCGD
jgi:hypothetical protein